MDIEEQIEKAEKLESPSLYKGRSKSKPKKHSILDSSIGASLDDLISEGALLGSEEDFDRFLDDTGHVKSDARYNPVEEEEKEKVQKSTLSKTEQSRKDVLEPQLKEASPGVPESVPISATTTVDETVDKKTDPKISSLYETENYSAPNLSEYQLKHQISDHSDLLDSVKSYDLNKLPSSSDRERSKTNDLSDSPARVPIHAGASPARKAPAAVRHLDFGENANVRSSDSLHTPYFPTYERSPSRSRSNFRERSSERSARSRSTSTAHPHLARGDTYKSTHPETPLKYEHPADFDLGEEDEEDDRATRQTKPTMGESIAAAEASSNQQSLKEFHGEEGITRDPSLVTTGDYTNFNVDTRRDEYSLYSGRSQSSYNYLRSISRSRSRQPKREPVHDEKNDANPEELAHEGALISDDPYDQVEDFDNVMKNVVSPAKDQNASRLADAAKSQKQETKPRSDPADVHVTDVSAEEKDAETKEQLLAESAPTVSAKDIHVDSSEVDNKTHHEFTSDTQHEAQEKEPELAKIDEDAEEKEKEAKEQLIAEEAPTVTASDIKVSADDDAPERERSAVPEEETESAADGDDSKRTKQADSTETEPSSKVASEKDSEPEMAGPSHSREVSEVDEADPNDHKNDDSEIVGEKEEKSNLISETAANVSEHEQARDIKDEELSSNKVRRDSLIAEGGEIENISEVSEKTTAHSVDQEGKEVEHKVESPVSKMIQSDDHGAKVPEIDFKKEKNKAAPEIETAIEQPTLLGETANDDKELEAEDVEAAEANRDEDVTRIVNEIDKAETDAGNKEDDDEEDDDKEDDDKEDDDKKDEREVKDFEAPSKAEENEISMSHEDTEIKEVGSKDTSGQTEEHVSVKDTPEKDEEVVEVKNETVPSEESQAKATNVLAHDDETQEVNKSTSEDTVEQSVEDPDKSETPSGSTEATEQAPQEKEIAPNETKSSETSTPKSANKGWFGSITAGIGAVVGGAGATTAAASSENKDDEFDVSPEELRKHLQSLPVYIFTSLAGGMQIMQRTNRLTTILQANGVKFEYRDLGTDEEAKKLWRRYSQGKTLPGVVRGDDYIGNWQEVEELNEEYILTKRLWEEL
ncbi:hypothetical protein CJI97_001745 [Candidozyma auris]|nr:hypothetical protein CJI97_001745 [[Candida] auris]